jgi:hypothetical protein
MMRSLFWLALVAGCQGAVPPEVSTGALLSYPTNTPAQGVDYSQSVTGIKYSGAPMTHALAVHFIFYGDWTQKQNQINEVLNFANGLSGSPIARVLTTYYDEANFDHTRSSFTVDYIVDNGSQGVSNFMDTAAVASVIDYNVSHGFLPMDPNAAYIVLLDPATTVGSYCSNDTCGAHQYDTNQSQILKYAWVGNPQTCVNQGGASCLTYNKGSSPNDDPIIDSMVGFIWHELAELLTDPIGGYRVNLPASENEIGDVCAHKWFEPVAASGFDPYYTTGNGSWGNVNLGGADYFLQPIWQNADRGGCVQRAAYSRPAAAPANTLGMVTGDFDGNGIGDLLWRDSATGMVSVWLLGAPDSTVLSTGNLGTVGSRWQIVGIADFTGDGTADILWRDYDQGGLWLWEMNGLNIVSDVQIFNAMDPHFLVKAVGAFNGGTRAGILFQDMRTNATYLWANAGSLSPPSDVTSLPYAVPGLSSSDDSEVVGTGDFNDDHASDILWHNLADGSFFIWTFNGTHETTTTVDTSQLGRVLGIVDVDHDGTADIVGMGGGGNFAWLRMMNGAPLELRTVRAMPPDQWRFSGGSVYGDTGNTGILWRNRQTGSLDRWDLSASGAYLSGKDLAPNHALNAELVGY